MALALSVSNIRGDVVAEVVVPATGDTTRFSGSGATSFDEHGNTVTGTIKNTRAVSYGWLGSKERAVTEIGLTLMGVRPDNSVTGRFLALDLVTGGNENDYDYPNDPINKNDINGRNWWSAVAHTAFGVVVGIAAGLAGVALCAGAAGFGCAIMATIAVGMLPSMLGDLAIDKAFDEKTTARKAIKYMFNSTVGLVTKRSRGKDCENRKIRVQGPWGSVETA